MYILQGEEVIYLDPHTTQRSGSVDQKLDEEEIDLDTTYHCKVASRILITGMDPSVALVSIYTSQSIHSLITIICLTVFFLSYRKRIQISL